MLLLLCRLVAAARLLGFLPQAPVSTPCALVAGNLRVEAVTPHLVRIEQKGPEGFEDRDTFTVVNRPQPLAAVPGNMIDLGEYKVLIPADQKAEDVKIEDSGGNVVYQWDGRTIPHRFLPGPEDGFMAFAISDNPRIVPPAWGATPQPDGNQKFRATSGWDAANDAPDIYVFLRGSQGYEGLRRDFLNLTGHTPMPPLAAFGFWDSRYYEYTQTEAMSLIDEYRGKGYPLDFLVVDTDWRVNGSHGYQVAAKDFPDMPGFIKAAHGRHVRLMYNDHPEPVDQRALSPKEFEFRFKGLGELLNWGADVWWYDRNWSTVLHEPAPGISKEVWGARVFHDVTQRLRPNLRPLIMSNVEGIDNGLRHYPPHPAFHRFPIWWTGDTIARWEYLRNGIANGVDSGVASLLPYVNEDLGGHISHPTPELYVRYLQYGALSPVTRIHCTKGEDRHPWAFGPEAEEIVKNYIKLRYRLLPIIYGAARRAYDDGTPLLRRCDLEWPQYKEAADDQQYMLGDDLLVAPTNQSLVPEGSVIPAAMLHTGEGQAGLKGEYFANPTISGQPSVTKVDRTVDFDWSGGSPVKGIPAENFTVRWTGGIGPIPETGEYKLAVRSDDGARLFVDGKKIVDSWGPQAEATAYGGAHLEQGKRYRIELDYLQLGGDDLVHLEWVKPSQIKTKVTRTLWLPPGQWDDVWTGETLMGPQTITVDSPLWHTAMFVRRGGIVFTAPEMQYTGEKPWDPMTADVYPADAGEVVRALYEDDGTSNDYLMSGFRTTAIRCARRAEGIEIDIDPSQGGFAGAMAKRGWVFRVHLRQGEAASSVTVDGLSASAEQWSILPPQSEHVSMPFLGAGSRSGPGGGSIVEIRLPPTSVSGAQAIDIRETIAIPLAVPNSRSNVSRKRKELPVGWSDRSSGGRPAA